MRDSVRPPSLSSVTSSSADTESFTEGKGDGGREKKKQTQDSENKSLKVISY